MTAATTINPATAIKIRGSSPAEGGFWFDVETVPGHRRARRSQPKAGRRPTKPEPAAAAARARSLDARRRRHRAEPRRTRELPGWSGPARRPMIRRGQRRRRGEGVGDRRRCRRVEPARRHGRARRRPGSGHSTSGFSFRRMATRSASRRNPARSAEHEPGGLRRTPVRAHLPSPAASASARSSLTVKQTAMRLPSSAAS